MRSSPSLVAVLARTFSALLSCWLGVDDIYFRRFFCSIWWSYATRDSNVYYCCCVVLLSLLRCGFVIAALDFGELFRLEMMRGFAAGVCNRFAWMKRTFPCQHSNSLRVHKKLHRRAAVFAFSPPGGTCSSIACFTMVSMDRGTSRLLARAPFRGSGNGLPRRANLA